MKIVCGTDLSQHPRAVERVAIDLAGRMGGSVELVHVVDPPSRHIHGPNVDIDALERTSRESSEARLNTEREELSEIGRLPIAVYPAEGEVENVLFARSKKGGADLIVIGAYGRSALQRMILGSVADRIVRYADRPVLILPPTA